MISNPTMTKREQIWVYAWGSVASGDSCKYSETATAFADACLEDFDERFKQIEEEI